MKPDDLPNPILLTPQSAVLLIFMPHKGADRRQQVLLTALADTLKEQFDGLLRVLRIDEATHPDVVRSFAITQTPAFVLVQKGIELWRHEGMADESTLMLPLRRLLPVKAD